MKILPKNKSVQILEKFLGYFNIADTSRIVDRFVDTKTYRIGPIGITNRVGNIIPNLIYKHNPISDKFERMVAIDNLHENSRQEKYTTYDFASIITQYLENIKIKTIYVICDNLSKDDYIGRIIELSPSEIPKIIKYVNANAYFFGEEISWVYSIHSREFSYFAGSNKSISALYKLAPEIADYTFSLDDEII